MATPTSSLAQPPLTPGSPFLIRGAPRASFNALSLVNWDGASPQSRHIIHTFITTEGTRAREASKACLFLLVSVSQGRVSHEVLALR